MLRLCAKVGYFCMVFSTLPHIITYTHLASFPSHTPILPLPHSPPSSTFFPLPYDLLTILHLPTLTDHSVMAGNCQTGSLRLGNNTVTANTSEGRVEICINNAWGTICDDLFGRTDAAVVCGSMGGYKNKSRLCKCWGKGSWNG